MSPSNAFICRRPYHARSVTMPQLAMLTSEPHFIAQPKPIRDQRHDVRIARRLAVHCRQLSATDDTLRRCSDGFVVNMSPGGLCVHTDAALGVFSCIRCELQLESIVAVPTLLQVRWTRQLDDGSYLNGLVYML